MWSYPLVLHLGTHLPGPGAGDNIDFLWNFWWMRTALASNRDFFYTPFVFAPHGVDLTLHTHTALSAFMGATVLRGVSIGAAQNLTILAALFLNGCCAYMLAWRATRDYGAALVAGLVFGGSPYVMGHLNGHFNLISAWTIPFFAMAASEAVQSGTIGAAVMAGLVLGITAYIDYYYVVYESALMLCLSVLVAGTWSARLRGKSARTSWLRSLVAVLILLDLFALTTIVLTGGFEIRLGTLTLTGRDTFNPLQAFWVLSALLWLIWTRPYIEVRLRDARFLRRLLRTTLLVAGVSLIVAGPIVWRGAALVLEGAYVEPPRFWRSGSRGIDLASLVLGNPFNGWWGPAVQSLYRRMGLDPVETTAWLGIVPMLLAGTGLRGLLRKEVVEGQWTTPARQWTMVGVAFFVWALGPHLMLFGMNTAMPLPHALLRYLPIVSNARIPGRAMVVSYLALAMLCAMAFAEWRRSGRGSHLILGVVCAGILADFLAAPFPLFAPERPAIYDVLRARPETGAVCELPLGLRDGFGEQGKFNDEVLFDQTIHQRPLVGGFVARLPLAISAAYAADPLLSALIHLSSRAGASAPAQHFPDAEVAVERLRANGISFVVLNTATASSTLAEYVERVMPLEPIAREGDRRLYVVTRPK